MNKETILELLKTRFVELTALSVDNFAIEVWNPPGYVLMTISGLPTGSYLVSSVHETYHVYVEDPKDHSRGYWLREIDIFLRRFYVEIDIRGVTYED